MSARLKKPVGVAKNQRKQKMQRKQRNDEPIMRIDRTMRVSEILALLPDSATLLAQYGLSCFSCSANATENLEEGCRSHGFADEELDDLVTDLNEMLKDRPERPQTLILTKEGALKLREMLDVEGKSGWGLLVGLDETGGFAMEFVEKKNAQDKTFQCDDVPNVKIYASAMTLFSIGGSTIDFREGGFKLDLPDRQAGLPTGQAGLPTDASKGGCGCASGGKCGCQ